MKLIDAIEARVKAATPGPWKVDEDDNGFAIRMGTAITSPAQYQTQHLIEYEIPLGDVPKSQYEEAAANALLIAHARADIEALLRVVRAGKKYGFLRNAADELMRTHYKNWWSWNEKGKDNEPLLIVWLREIGIAHSVLDAEVEG